MPYSDPPRRGKRRDPSCSAPAAIYVVRLYEAGEYRRTIPIGFSASGAVEFVRCYNHLSRRRNRFAEAERVLLDSA